MGNERSVDRNNMWCCNGYKAIDSKSMFRSDSACDFCVDWRGKVGDDMIQKMDTVSHERKQQ
jgi:hypothetical protein